MLTQKSGHVRIRPIDTIRPAPENEKLYRPVDPDDAGVKALADSIAENGIQEPIVISADGYILSGHRRYVAAQMAGLIEVPCRVHPVCRNTDSDGFVRLLREFNRQRVKSFDEIVREEVVSADPEEAYQSLFDERQEMATVSQATIRSQLDTFLKRYWRDLLRSQPNHIEVVVEKNTVESIIKPVTMEYTIPLISGRGYCPLPPRHAMAERFTGSGKEQLILLFLSDFDPDGEEIAAGFARSMRDDFEIENIVPVKVALTDEQVRRFSLPPMMTAKESSRNCKKFTGQHRKNVYELEAMRPEDLQTVLREAIESVIDREALNHELEVEKNDAVELTVLRQQVRTILMQLDDFGMGGD